MSVTPWPIDTGSWGGGGSSGNTRLRGGACAGSGFEG